MLLYFQVNPALAGCRIEGRWLVTMPVKQIPLPSAQARCCVGGPETPSLSWAPNLLTLPTTVPLMPCAHLTQPRATRLAALHSWSWRGYSPLPPSCSSAFLSLEQLFSFPLERKLHSSPAIEVLQLMVKMTILHLRLPSLSALWTGGRFSLCWRQLPPQLLLPCDFWLLEHQLNCVLRWNSGYWSNSYPIFSCIPCFTYCDFFTCVSQL